MYGSPALVLLLCSVADASLGFRSGRHHQPDSEKQLQPQAPKDALRLNAQKANSSQGEKADPCACEFKGECSCMSSLEFMDCISAACASGSCDCHEHQYHNACVDMANTCVSLEFKCESQKATCSMVTGANGTEMSGPESQWSQESTEALQAEVADLIEKKCRLEEAEKDGWLNADNRLKTLVPEIEAKVKELKARDAEVPDINDCSPKKPAEKPVAKEVQEKPAVVKSMAMPVKSALPLIPLVALTTYVL